MPLLCLFIRWGGGGECLVGVGCFPSFSILGFLISLEEHGKTMHTKIKLEIWIEFKAKTAGSLTFTAPSICINTNSTVSSLQVRGILWRWIVPILLHFHGRIQALTAVWDRTLGDIWLICLVWIPGVFRWSPGTSIFVYCSWALVLIQHTAIIIDT